MKLIKSIIYLGADHAGFGQKEDLKIFLNKLGCSVIDCGTNSFDAVDYPDVAELVCNQQKKDKNSYGILVCGSGVGVCIAANKIKNIRAAVVDRKELAYYAIAHDDANVLCLSSRFTSFVDNCEIIRIFLTTEFEGGRHNNRINKISKLEN